MDASLFRSIPIRESVVMRFKAGFFNVLNMPGILPGGARQLQLTLRLTW